MRHDGTPNLIPNNLRSKEEVKRNAAKGGVNSGKTRRAQRSTAELINIMLRSKLDENNAKKVKQLGAELSKEDLNVNSLMIAGQIKSAVNGNVTAFETLQKYNANIEKLINERSKFNMPITDITIDFVELYREMQEAFKTGKWREFILKGGRGSAKSNIISAFAEETIYNDPKAHVVFTRRYKTDLRGSVYNQFLKTVTRHDKLDEWEFTTSPMMAKYKKTGQCVVFVGCDKPISLKSYNLSFGYVKMIVNEECDEMAGIEQIDNVEDTFLRADVNSISVKVFNPPKSANNWMNQYTLDAPEREKCYVCHSYYYNVPKKWLGQRFFDRAEWFKNNKPRYYENNYLGKVTGTGGSIFENVEIREITDQEINSMKNFYYGLDFGYQHPNVFIQCSYDSDTDILYIIKEVFSKKCKQVTFAKKIKEYKNVEIIADSARPDSIAEYQDWGFDMIPATKRWKGGGRDYAWEWLQQCKKIIIDPVRTPQTAKEFTTLEFEVLKDGTFSSAYPTLNEDCLMATAYALNRVIIDTRKESLYCDFDECEDYEDDSEE